MMRIKRGFARAWMLASSIGVTLVGCAVFFGVFVFANSVDHRWQAEGLASGFFKYRDKPVVMYYVPLFLLAVAAIALMVFGLIRFVRIRNR